MKQKKIGPHDFVTISKDKKPIYQNISDIFYLHIQKTNKGKAIKNSKLYLFITQIIPLLQKQDFKHQRNRISWRSDGIGSTLDPLFQEPVYGLANDIINII